MKKLFLPVLALAVVLAGCQLSTSDTTSDQPVKVGVISPLSGDASLYGQLLQQGEQLALKQAGAADRITMIYEDSQCTNNEAVTAFNKLTGVDNAHIILGPECSGSVLAVAPLADQKQTLLFSASASSPEITTAGDFIFRITPSDLEITQTAATDIFNRFGHAKVATITEVTDYCTAFQEAFADKWRELGGEITVSEEFLSGDQDLKTQLLKISASEPDAIMIITQSSATGGLTVKQIKNLGIDVPLYASGTVNGQDVFDVAGEENMEGLILWHPLLDESQAPVQNFLTQFEKDYQEAPVVPILATAGYDRMMILLAGLDQCGDDPACLRDYLYDVRDYQGLSGVISFDENGDNTMKSKPLVAAQGKFIPLE